LETLTLFSITQFNLLKFFGKFGKKFPTPQISPHAYSAIGTGWQALARLAPERNEVGDGERLFHARAGGSQGLRAKPHNAVAKG
jgi:hypothetical protein